MLLLLVNLFIKLKKIAIEAFNLGVTLSSENAEKDISYSTGFVIQIGRAHV